MPKFHKESKSDLLLTHSRHFLYLIDQMEFKYGERLVSRLLTWYDKEAMFSFSFFNINWRFPGSSIEFRGGQSSQLNFTSVVSYSFKVLLVTFFGIKLRFHFLPESSSAPSITAKRRGRIKQR